MEATDNVLVTYNLCLPYHYYSSWLKWGFNFNVLTLHRIIYRLFHVFCHQSINVCIFNPSCSWWVEGPGFGHRLGEVAVVVWAPEVGHPPVVVVTKVCRTSGAYRSNKVISPLGAEISFKAKLHHGAASVFSAHLSSSLDSRGLVSRLFLASRVPRLRL